MRDNIPITMPNRRGVACNAPNAVTAMVGYHTPLCNDIYPIRGVSLQMGVADNAPTVIAICKTGNFRGEMGKQPPQKGRHAGLPLQHPQPTAKYGDIRNPNVGATLAVALNAHTHTQGATITAQGANTTIQNSTTTAQGDRKGRPYGTTTTTGDTP